MIQQIADLLHELQARDDEIEALRDEIEELKERLAVQESSVALGDR